MSDETWRRLLAAPLSMFLVQLFILRFLLKESWRRSALTSLLLCIVQFLFVKLAQFFISDKTVTRILFVFTAPALTALVLRYRTTTSWTRRGFGVAGINLPVILSLLIALRADFAPTELDAAHSFQPVRACPEGQRLVQRSASMPFETGCVDPAHRRQGRWSFFHPDGSKSLMASYLDGNPEGDFAWWHPNGRPFQKGSYKNGRPHGAWATWMEDGTLRGAGSYEDGSLVSGSAVYPVTLPDGTVSQDK